MTIKNFVGICVLTASLAFGFWGCSSSDSSKKETFPCFEYGDDETQITGYKEKDSKGNVCDLDVEIPDGVTHIAEDAFKDKGITSVTFPESVEDIGANAFAGNAFPSSYVVYIPNENATVDIATAFDSSVIVAKEGTDDCFEISSNALSDYYCMAQEVTIPDGVTSIEEGVFENKGLTSVTLPSALESIENNAFKDNDLEDLTIPDTVTAIGNHAFAGNSRLTDAIQILDVDAEVADDAFPNGYYHHGVKGNTITDLSSICADARVSQTGCGGETTITGDSNTEYDIVEIGNQCWFAENLKEAPSNFVPKPTWVNSAHVGWYGYYGEDDADITDESTQGYLYHWAAAMNNTNCLEFVDCGVSRTQGACPEGWHVPSDCEYMTLEAELGMSESDQVKTSASDYRNSNNSNVGTQLSSEGTSGFNITPVGFRSGVYGTYLSALDNNTDGDHFYWTSDTRSSAVLSHAFYRNLRRGTAGLTRSGQEKLYAMYVRCLKD